MAKNPISKFHSFFYFPLQRAVELAKGGTAETLHPSPLPSNSIKQLNSYGLIKWLFEPETLLTDVMRRAGD